MEIDKVKEKGHEMETTSIKEAVKAVQVKDNTQICWFN